MLAGSINAAGYRMIAIQGKDYLAHRLVWFVEHDGKWPEAGLVLDHISGDRDDNRIINLREATNGENTAHTTKGKRSSTGFRGVHEHRKGRYQLMAT
jgi:hypothetical protein